MHITPPTPRPCRLRPKSSRIRPVMHVRPAENTGWEVSMSLEEAEAFHREFAAELKVCRSMATVVRLASAK